MPEKLLNLKELSAYLDIQEEDLKRLVDEHIIPAYEIGGSFLRFRKEQIDAIKDEILSRTPYITPTYRVKLDMAKKQARIESTETIGDRILDFIYFSDFYLFSALLIAFMIYVIIKM